MFVEQMMNERKVVKAFHKLFLDEQKNLKPEAKIVLEFLRNESGALGELGNHSQPYFYDATNRFDAHAAIFALGKRRLFDVMCGYLYLDEQKLYNL